MKVLNGYYSYNSLSTGNDDSLQYIMCKKCLRARRA